MDLITLAMAKAYSDSKGGYVENTQSVVLPETALAYSADVVGYPFEAVLVAGKKYTVMFEGVKYQSEATNANQDGTEFVSLGNAKLSGAADTGEPWFIMYIPAYSMSILTPADGIDQEKEQPSLTLAIYEETETVHTIDPKFLPGVCLPVVELTTVPTKEGAPLTEAESAAIQAAYDTGMPCVVRCNLAMAENGIATMSMLFFRTYIALGEMTEKAFGAEISGARHMIFDNAGAWVFLGTEI